MFSLGFIDKEYIFYEIKEEAEELAWINDAVAFAMSKDFVRHDRQVYGVFDLLGDIGGLYSILQSFG